MRLLVFSNSSLFLEPVSLLSLGISGACTYKSLYELKKRGNDQAGLGVGGSQSELDVMWY